MLSQIQKKSFRNEFNFTVRKKWPTLINQPDNPDPIESDLQQGSECVDGTK